MSIHAMTLVWRVTNLSQSETLVALALADHANDEGFCWPSMKTIARKARLSERQVRRVIRQLEEEHGILLYAEKPGKTHTYKLDLRWLEKLAARADTMSGVETPPRTFATDPGHNSVRPPRT